MSSEIADALSVLNGLPMWAAGRAGPLLWLHFGGTHEFVDRYRANEAKTVGDYALHIDCPWRIVQRDVVVVGALDRFSPGDGQEDDDFDWNHSRDTRWDRRLQQFMERYGTSGPIVRAIEMRGAGAFALRFDDEVSLDVLPNRSTDGEYWRLFEPYRETPHVVVIGDTTGRVYIEEHEE